MSPWTLPSLLPLLVLSGTLGVGLLLRDRQRWPLALHCLSLTAWSSAILLAELPGTRDLGERLLMIGFFVPATYLHTAARELRWTTPAVPIAYALGALMLGSSLAVGGLYLADGGSTPGVLFWPMFTLSGLVSVVPLALLAWAPERGQRRTYLWLAGVTTHTGGAINNLLSLADVWSPLGLYVMLLSIGLLTYAIRSDSLPTFGRFVERSGRYTVLAALLSASWMLALVAVVQGPAGWSWEAMALLFVLTLTMQPLIAEARSLLAGWVFPQQHDAEGLSRALEASEARAEHAERLAELGVLASAVAHEVRNPLGVIHGCVALLEREGADPEVLDEIRSQVGRAAEFADDLLEYGRPQELRVREVDLAATAQMAASEVRQVLSDLGVDLTIEVQGEATVDADLTQMLRLFSVLFDNAGLAGATQVHVHIVASHAVRVTIDDDGPGLPDELRSRLFEAFVTGRGRQGPRPGTGLGLAIAQGIAQRHRGTLTAASGQSALGGARFVVELPPRQTQG